MSLVATAVSLHRGAATLLSSVSVRVEPGELLVLVGPNGAGKSTLLSLLAGDDEPDAGVVTLDGRALQDLTLSERAARRAVVGPPPALAFDYSVRDVVAMGWLHGERFGQVAPAEALGDVLEACELSDLAGRAFRSLSSGEKQRAQFARGWLQLWRPAGDRTARWLLLDEPNANLDVAHGLRLLEDLQRLAGEGLGVLAVLHDLDLAARFADRIVLLDHGRAVASGKPEAVLSADRLSHVYGAPVHVEHHAALGRLVVIA
ncbi:heme ABC transporter ATP-binding protein [Pseudohaliea rubra]|uniref:ABC-type hemin transport system, ATPase component n=1 Tax=Pseudohaliea rubra DSM 19751 TaxID=1265313 RepID=A0A095VPH6_9GAMM|nr:heme ABC transporter ATP-binding protein [Pseudohaliea rubra]KGE03008.1 ABC-type hemin transport system, ATPase component [Pseudohaliea rubra DSM 19751]